MVITWKPQFILKVIKESYVELFGFSFMSICNNKISRKISCIPLGQAPCPFFKFLLIFSCRHLYETSPWVYHICGCESSSHQALTIGSPFNQHQFPTLKGTAIPESFGLLSTSGVWIGLILSELWVWKSFVRMLACYWDRTTELDINMVSACSSFCFDAV